MPPTVRMRVCQRCGSGGEKVAQTQIGGKGLAGEAGKYLSFSEGGMLCGPCGSAVAEKWPITPVGLRILGDLSGALDSGRPADPSQADARRSQELLDYWIRAALNREPKTAHLLR